MTTTKFCICGSIDGHWNSNNLINCFAKQLEKLNNQLAEAEAALEARKKPPEEGQKLVGEGLVIDEWVYTSLSWHEIFYLSLVQC